MSSLLEEQGYFGSCAHSSFLPFILILSFLPPFVFSSFSPVTTTCTDNIAWDPFIRDISGFDEQESLYGSWFSYNATPRALIYARDGIHVNSYC